MREERRDFKIEAALLRHMLLNGRKNPNCRMCKGRPLAGSSRGRERLVASDFSTGYLRAFALAFKRTERVLFSFVMCFAHHKASAFHTNRAPELIAAVGGLPGPRVLQCRRGPWQSPDELDC